MLPPITAPAFHQQHVDDERAAIKVTPGADQLQEICEAIKKPKADSELEILSEEAVCRLLHIPPYYLSKLIADGLPSKKIAPGRRQFFSKKEVQACLLKKENN